MRNPFDIPPIPATPVPGLSHRGLDGDGTRAPPAFAFDAVSDQPPAGRILTLSFDADWHDYFRLWVVCQLLTLLTLGLYGPWARARRVAFLARHWRLDGHSFEVALEPRASLAHAVVPRHALWCHHAQCTAAPTTVAARRQRGLVGAAS